MNHHLDKYKRLQEQLTNNYASLIRTYNEIQEVMVTMEAACKGFNAGVNFGEVSHTLRSFTKWSKP